MSAPKTKGEIMLLAHIDQDRAAADDCYAQLTKAQRGEVAQWLMGQRGKLCEAPNDVLNFVICFAALAFMETGLRWRRRRQPPPAGAEIGGPS
jgi:hypothetical protein